MNKKIYDAVVEISNNVMERESSVDSKRRKATFDKSASFMESLEVDSLLALEIISRIEKKFGIKLKEEDFVRFDTLENIAELVEGKMKEKSLPSSARKDVKKSKTKKVGVSESAVIKTKKAVKASSSKKIRAKK